jgi:uncharacterized protein YcfL
MQNLQFVALALGLLVLAGCASYDRVAVRDYPAAGSARIASLTAPDPTPGAGGPGGSGAGAARR